MAIFTKVRSTPTKGERLPPFTLEPTERRNPFPMVQLRRPLREWNFLRHGPCLPSAVVVSSDPSGPGSSYDALPSSRLRSLLPRHDNNGRRLLLASSPLLLQVGASSPAARARTCYLASGSSGPRSLSPGTLRTASYGSSNLIGDGERILYGV